MTRIEPSSTEQAPEASRRLAAAHEAAGASMTNMKWTAAHAPAALRMLLEWYPLHERIAAFLGERRARLFAHAISAANDCLICSTYFRRELVDAGEDPDAPALDAEDELIVALGRRLADDPHGVDDALWAELAARYDEAQIVELIAFGAIMVATNVFNDALRIPLDGHLEPYRKAQLA